MDRRGFTLIELMVVVIIVGVLAAVAIPNFMAMQIRAQEASLMANMNVVQLTAEDFAAHNDGTYASDGSTTNNENVAFGAMMTHDLRNPFNPNGAVVVYNVPPANPGECAYQGSATGYTITGRGKYGMLPLILRNGTNR